MRKAIFAILAAAPLVAGCTATERGAVVGGATGAAIGGATTGDVRGAVVGGAIGAGVGALIGQASEPGYCRYRDRFGREFVRRCY